jgi:hypothetical protein
MSYPWLNIPANQRTSAPNLANHNARMDYERSSVLLLLRGPLLFTPQGWVVLLTALLCWAWVVYALFTREAPLSEALQGRAVSMLSLWPFLVFLFYVRLCTPHFQPSWNKAMLLAISAASLPALELLR